MKRGAKRGHARKGREIAMIHKTPSGSVPFSKCGHGSLSCQIGMPFDQGQSPMLYSRVRHSACDYHNSWQWHLKGFPPLTMGVSLQNVPPMSLSSTYCTQNQHLEVVQPCLPSEPELMTGGHLWQGTQSANKLGVLHATKKLYQQVLVYGVC